MSSDKPESSERPTRRLFRLRVEKQLQKENEERQRELLVKRMDVAKEGVSFYQKGQIIEALRFYQRYILILEMWKKCGRDRLHPSLFDRENDVYELILINGIYWDICRLYDKAKTESQLAELKNSLDKFYLFSKGFPFQPLAAETIRRYIASGKCRHLPEFKAVYLNLGGSRCFVASSFVEIGNPNTIPKLRFFRDHYLQKSAGGRALIRAYYRVGPTLANFLNRRSLRTRRRLSRLVDRIANFLA
jgi:hypothetical protein